MNKIYQELFEVIWEQVFPGISTLGVEEFKKHFVGDILLPSQYKCEISGEVVWSSPEYGYKRFISKGESIKRNEKDNFMEIKEPIGSLSEVLEKVKSVALFRGEREMNSSQVEESDDIYSSNIIYNSTHIYSSQKLLWCHNMVQSEYVAASKGSKNTTFSMRIIDSGNTANSFDISFCGNTANSYFCHNCFDIRDCMFCFHLASKRFCIANRQYEEAEYNEMKKKILADYFEQLPNGKFVGLQSL
jgi:hypothetical protein